MGFFDAHVDLQQDAPFACPHCNYTMKNYELIHNTQIQTVRCTKCSKHFSLTDVSFNISASTRANVKNGMLKNRAWFHLTVDPNWFDNIQNASTNQGDLLVHIGEKLSAFEIADNYLKFCPNAELHLFEIHLKNTANIVPTLVKDLNNWPKYTHEIKSFDFQVEKDCEAFNSRHQNPAIPYLNRFENAGSVSLLTSAKNFDFCEEIFF